MSVLTAYYNDTDPFCVEWLKNLIARGHIAAGDVDNRDIKDVLPSELAAYSQCHFFAGLGGWSLALRRAGWKDDRPVWTGSCPCQPFSAAGARGGFADERHVWPHFHWLIEQCRPAIVFGEQVASKAGLSWLDLVQTDLERTGYAVAAADLCAAGVGAPHIRQRLWWVADAKRNGGRPDKSQRPPQGRAAADGLSPWRDCDWLTCRDGKARPVEPGSFPLAHGIPTRVGRLRAFGNAIVPEVAAEFIGAFLG